VLKSDKEIIKNTHKKSLQKHKRETQKDATKKKEKTRRLTA